MTSLIYRKQTGNLPVLLETAAFHPPAQTGEWHVMFHTKGMNDSFTQQLEATVEALLHYKETELPSDCAIRFARCFITDAANQTEAILRHWEDVSLKMGSKAPLSIVQQPPLHGGKLTLWVYFSTPYSPSYLPVFHATRSLPSGDSESQIRGLLESYEEELREKGCSMELNCLRTWIFVRDVDLNYAGVVKGRTENFLKLGMNRDTHFITSTGIEGQSANPKELVLLDAYAMKGLKREQIQFLQAPTHLNPTYEYQVTFERGVAITYGDRQHVWISGTASINNKGEIVHPGDVVLQTRRMWQNVEALLAEAKCNFSDLAHLIVYLRDFADYPQVQILFKEQFPLVPTVFLRAPVCRPGWLIEMECMAIKETDRPEFAAL